MDKRRLTRRLETSTADQESVNVGLFRQVFTVLVGDRTAINDSGVLRCFFGYRGREPFADCRVNFLSLLRGCNFAGTDGPSYIQPLH